MSWPNFKTFCFMIVIEGIIRCVEDSPKGPLKEYEKAPKVHQMNDKGAQKVHRFWHSYVLDTNCIR